MSADATDPKYVRYLIALALIDGPELPPGEVEFRIIGTIAAAEPMAHEFEADDEPLRFRVTDWAGPYPPQDVVFEHRAVVPEGTDDPDQYGPLRGTYADALLDLEYHFGVDPRGDDEWFIESRAAHKWKRHGREAFFLPDPDKHMPDVCGRVLVGRGSDTFDPCCVLPAGHKEPCKP